MSFLHQNEGSHYGTDSATYEGNPAHLDDEEQYDMSNLPNDDEYDDENHDIYDMNIGS